MKKAFVFIAFLWVGSSVKGADCLVPANPFVSNRTATNVTISWTTECGGAGLAFGGSTYVLTDGIPGFLGSWASSLVTLSFQTPTSIFVTPNSRLLITAYAFQGGVFDSTAVTAGTLAVPPGFADGFDLRTSHGFRTTWLSGSLPSNNTPGTLYQVQVSTSLSFSPPVADETLTGLEYTASCLSPSTPYYVRARAINWEGIPSGFALFGSTTTLPPSTPTLSYSWLSGKVKADLNPGALTSFATVFFSSNPADQPISNSAIPGRLQAANQKMTRASGLLLPPLVPGALFEIAAQDHCPAQWLETLPAPTVLTYQYDTLGGEVPLLQGQARPKDLRFFRLDTEAGLWVRVPTTEVHEGTNSISAVVNTFGVFAVMAATGDSFQQAYPFPNPYRRSSGEGVTFTNLSARASLRLYTSSGRLVRFLEETDGDGQLRWDVANSDGESLAPGVYAYEIQSDAGRRRGKIVVLP